MKRQNPNERPVLSWCCICRNSESTMEVTLKSLRALTPNAEIVIVDTMSSDKSPEIAQRYADVWDEYKGPKGTWTREMHAFDDAAAARNRSFELASGQWVGWIDLDDELVGPEEVARLLAVNGYMLPGMDTNLGEKKGELDTAVGKQSVRTFESYLAAVLEQQPRVEGFYAPYLYRFKEGKEGEAGKAEEWQVRERIVRRREDGYIPWKWYRKAHEFLAPDRREMHGSMMHLAALLFVHRKKWTETDIRYSIDRHYKIVRDDYDQGKRDFMDLHYLLTYSKGKCPQDRAKFIDEFVEAAVTKMDRGRALCAKGLYLMEEGFFQQAIETFTAGTVADDSYPDNWFGLGAAFGKAGQWARSALAYEQGVKLPPTHPYSKYTPREHAVTNRIMAALGWWRAWRDRTMGIEALERAKKMADEALAEPGAKSADHNELLSYVNNFVNELEGAKRLEELYRTQQYLIANDETTKAAKLADLVPHNMEDHPVAVEMRGFAAKIFQHRDDAASYADFYEKIGTDKKTTDEQIDSMKDLGRARLVLHYLPLLRKAAGRPLNILEIGPWDGIITVNAMEALPDSRFTVIEASARGLKDLKERVEQRGWSDRFTAIHGLLSHETMTQAKQGKGSNRFDAIIFYEVIEHIVDPTKTLEEIRWALANDGKLFVSTPWGAFDRGNPRDRLIRDARGHVHAYTPRNLRDLLVGAGFRICEMNHVWSWHFEGNFGDTQALMAELAPPAPKLSPTVVVPSALWDWNATTVETTGMGASEETIVYLQRELGREGGSPEVFGPIPKEGTLDEVEARDGVMYWPLAQLTKLDPERPLIISRAPTFGLHVKDQLAKAGKPAPKKMILWLQDSFYPDLNTQVAEHYSKIVVLSQWHREAIVQATGISLEKIKIIPNFLLREHFPDVPSKCGIQREPHRFIYCSSPDRGLIPLLKMWPDIRAKWPDATLGIFYGWDGAMKLASVNPDWGKAYRKLRQEFNELRWQEGIEDYGRVNHVRIATEMRRASVWCYPTIGTSSVESFCSNAVKARAAGCVPVTLPEAALKETAASELTQWVEAPYKKEDFLAGIEKAIEYGPEARDAMAERAIEEYELGAVLPIWKKLLEG